MSTPKVVWRLSSGSDRRFRAGHPWVYSNELQGSPKGVEPGELVELRDAGGKFLAWGYGNPHSLIAFRALSRDEREKDFAQVPRLAARLRECWSFRESLGLTKASFRWIHGEADGFPGLVCDAYRLESAAWVFVLQAHSAGIDRLIPAFQEAIREVVGPQEWEHASVVLRRDLSVRKLEGIPVADAAEVARAPAGRDLTHAKVLIRSVGASGDIAAQTFEVDLVGGQKTGFFLDQSENVTQVARLLPAASFGAQKTIRILDLCCYAGQWGAKLARHYRAQGAEVHVTLVDASKKALEIARRNVEATGAQVALIEGDVLEDLKSLKDRSFDLIISDPPALIQGRKEIPQGTHAYLKLNTEVYRLVRSGGSVVACSCSQLLEEEEFTRVLSKAAYRHRRNVRYIARGTQAMDHPLKLEFPEGRYLKMLLARVSDVEEAPLAADSNH